MKEEIQAAIVAAIAPTQLDIALEGNHCTIELVSEKFEGLNQVKRQQLVYQCINDKIASGELHAVNIKAKSVSEL